jgi:acyl-CoA synthetase (AMP-forming)/AMP-acid ligase II
LNNLFTNLSRFGTETAVITDNGEHISYQGLADLADKTANGIGEKRTLVAVECDNSMPSLCAYLGAVRGGHAVLLIDGTLPTTLKSELTAKYRVRANWSAAHRTWEWPAPEELMPSLHPDLVVLLSTSGTTGSAKLVRLSEKNIHANAASIIEYLTLSPEERPITALPMHYSYGLSVVHSHLAVGATLLLTGQSIASRKFWDFLKAESATSFSGVPTMYEMLRRLRFEDMRLPSLRTLTQAGGRLSPGLVEYFAGLTESRGQRFWVMYGQTEATARMAYLPPEYASIKPNSIGRPIPGGTFKLVDQSGAPVALPNTEGELVYTGANVMMGYATEPEDLANGDDLNSELATGDLAWRDEEGFFYISGRLKRFIKVFGKRIGLDEVESFAQATGLQAAATGKDDLLLLAVIAPPRSTAEIKAEVSHYYRLHHSAVRVVTVPAFPTSKAGKVQYPLLLESLLDTGGRPLLNE